MLPEQRVLLFRVFSRTFGSIGPHLQVQVEWKNGEISWVAADAMREQNPFVFLPYVMKRKLSDHPHFKWIMKYAKDKM